jgi:hypothetical protein
VREENMRKPVHEETLATVLLALAGVAALVVTVPEWAQPGVVVFAAIFAGVAIVVDEDIRHAVRLFLDSRLRGNDAVPAKSKPAKAPAANRAVT